MMENSTVARDWGQLVAEKSVAQAVGERIATLWYIAPPFDPQAHDPKDIVGDAIPIFILLMVAEFLYGWLVMRKTLYTFGDTLGSLLSGITQQWFSLLVHLVTLPLYIRLYEEYSPTKDLGRLPTTAMWIATAIGTDFVYYWFHRWSHEFQALWSAHRVHHSGECYNLATALRQGAYQPLAGFVINGIPLALLGLPPRWFLLHGAMKFGHSHPNPVSIYKCKCMCLVHGACAHVACVPVYTLTHRCAPTAPSRNSGSTPNASTSCRSALSMVRRSRLKRAAACLACPYPARHTVLPRHSPQHTEPPSASPPIPWQL